MCAFFISCVAGALTGSFVLSSSGAIVCASPPHDPPFPPVYRLLSLSSNCDQASGILWDHHGDQWTLETDDGRISRTDSW